MSIPSIPQQQQTQLFKHVSLSADPTDLPTNESAIPFATEPALHENHEKPFRLSENVYAESSNDAFRSLTPPPPERDWNLLTVRELRIELGLRGIKQAGKKEELVARLEEYEAEQRAKLASRKDPFQRLLPDLDMTPAFRGNGQFVEMTMEERDDGTTVMWISNVGYRKITRTIAVQTDKEVSTQTDIPHHPTPEPDSDDLSVSDPEEDDDRIFEDVHLPLEQEDASANARLLRSRARKWKNKCHRLLRKQFQQAKKPEAVNNEGNEPENSSMQKTCTALEMLRRTSISGPPNSGLDVRVPSPALRTIPPPNHYETATLHITPFVRPLQPHRVQAVFEPYGHLRKFWMNRIRSIAIVMYDNVDEATSARDSLWGTEYNGKILEIEYTTRENAEKMIKEDKKNGGGRAIVMPEDWSKGKGRKGKGRHLVLQKNCSSAPPPEGCEDVSNGIAAIADTVEQGSVRNRGKRGRSFTPDNAYPAAKRGRLESDSRGGGGKL